MFRKLGLAVLALGFLAVAASATAHPPVAVTPGSGLVASCPHGVAVPIPVWGPYLPAYYPPPAVSFGTYWDADHRAIRYNRYFQRHQPPPRIQGFTLR